MASLNNVFLLAGEPYKRYAKTVPSKVAGTRLDPMTTGYRRPIAFMLNYSPTEDDAEAEVLCVYSEEEDIYIRQANRPLFDMGMLKEYNGKALYNKDAISENFMSDEEVRTVASITKVRVLSAKLKTITSYFTVARILRAAEEAGTKKELLDLIRARQAELAPL